MEAKIAWAFPRCSELEKLWKVPRAEKATPVCTCGGRWFDYNTDSGCFQHLLGISLHNIRHSFPPLPSPAGCPVLGDVFRKMICSRVNRLTWLVIDAVFQLPSLGRATTQADAQWTPMHEEEEDQGEEQPTCLLTAVPRLNKTPGTVSAASYSWKAHLALSSCLRTPAVCNLRRVWEARSNPCEIAKPTHCFSLLNGGTDSPVNQKRPMRTGLWFH